MKVTKEVISNIVKEEILDLLEDGHEDVPSARRAMQTIIEDASQMLQALEQMDGTLPTWWTNKMAVASSSLNKMRDYLLVPGEKSLDEGEKDYPNNSTMKKLVGQAKMDGRYKQDDPEKLKKDYDKHVRDTRRDPKYNRKEGLEEGDWYEPHI